MIAILNTPLDRMLSDGWENLDCAVRRAFFIVIAANLLAFGYEMTNLTLHHDDVIQIFIQDDILGHYLGRFGVGKLHYYLQNAYFMPFLQMTVGIVFMTIYGLLVGRFWGLKKTADLAVVASILCLFPYMAQVYQYNTSMATYSLAHLLAAGAVILSTRAALVPVAAGALLYVAAFSIYQGVIANSATIFIVWLLLKLLFPDEAQPFYSRPTLKSILAALASVIVGGLIYLLAVSFMDLQFDDYQSADKAFSLSGGIDLSYAVEAILKGTRSFYFWPEHYFPNYLKKLQLFLLLGGTVACLWLPKRAVDKLMALLLLGVAALSPRMLQLLHPEGNYHALTLTAYAVMIAGAVTMINRAGSTLARNAAIATSFILLWGYALQCNWISTVNQLNTQAHFLTMTQMLARVRTLPDADWDGRHIVVVGSYDMPSDYPYLPATGVATEFINAGHMQHLTNLMRDEARFVAADASMPKVLEYAANHKAWPDPESVAVVDGKGVVVLSNTPVKPKKH